MLTGCTQDETLSPTAGDDLPADTYPLQIGNITLTAESSEQPWTRVSETDNGSQWDGGETIAVRIGSGTPGTYVLNADGTPDADRSTPAYWLSTASGQAITAWYPTTPGQIDLNDQTGGLAYILKANTTADFNTSVSLHFEHQLAKVRVTLTTNGYSFANTPAVYLKGITTCTLGEDGTFTPSTETGDISTHTVTAGQVYEATLWPQEGIGEDFIRLTDGTKSATATLEQSPLDLEAGHLYTFNLTVRPHTLTLTLVGELPGWGTEDDETEL